MAIAALTQREGCRLEAYRDSVGVWTIGVGHHEMPYCIGLPRSVRPEGRLRVRFTPMVHGWLDLWPLLIWTPDVVDPPWAEAPL